MRKLTVHFKRDDKGTSTILTREISPYQEVKVHLDTLVVRNLVFVEEEDKPLVEVGIPLAEIQYWTEEVMAG